MRGTGTDSVQAGLHAFTQLYKRICCARCPLDSSLEPSTLTSYPDLNFHNLPSQELRARCDALQSLVGVQLESDGYGGDAVAGLLKAPTHAAVHHVLQERSRKLASDVQALKHQVGFA